MSVVELYILDKLERVTTHALFYCWHLCWRGWSPIVSNVRFFPRPFSQFMCRRSWSDSPRASSRALISLYFGNLSFVFLSKVSRVGLPKQKIRWVGGFSCVCSWGTHAVAWRKLFWFPIRCVKYTVLDNIFQDISRYFKILYSYIFPPTFHHF